MSAEGGTVSIELAVPEGLARSVALIYQYKPSCTITFDDGETITVETEYMHNETGRLLARTDKGERIGINMERVATMEADLCPSEALLAKLIACGITSAELAEVAA